MRTSKRQRNRYVLVLFFFLSLLGLAGRSMAGPLLNPQSILSDVKVTVNGVEETYVLIQNILNPTQWYCANLDPKLVEKYVYGDGTTSLVPMDASQETLDRSDPLLIKKYGSVDIEPELTLIKFQRRDEKNPKKLIEGAYLKVTLNIGPSDEALAKLKALIPPLPDRKPIRLSPLPIEGIELFIKHPRGGTVTATASSTPGLASAFASRNVEFSIPLTNALDATLIEALLNGETGALYGLRYNYQVLGVSKPQIQNEWGSRKRGSSRRRERDELSRILEIENMKLLRKKKAIAKTPSLSQIKDPIRKEKEKKRLARENTRVDVARSQRSLAAAKLVNRERTGMRQISNGFFGLSKYSPEVRERCVFVESDPDVWRKAYLAMPFVGQLPELRVDKITLVISLLYQSVEYGKQTVTWTPEKGWRDEHDMALRYARFSLDTLLADHPDGLPEARFRLEKEIVSNGDDILRGTDEIEVLAGDNPVTNPAELADLLTLDLSYLSWENILYVPVGTEIPDPDNLRVAKIDIVLQEGNRRFSKVIKPQLVNGVAVIPENFYWLVNRENFENPTEVKATIQFHLENGRRVLWPLSGKSLRELFPTLYIAFFDEDLKEK